LLSASSIPPAKETIVYRRDSGSRELESIAWPRSDIYSMNADGTNVMSLTRDGHSHTASWSPDRRILFIHDSVQRGYTSDDSFHHPVELYVMNRDGSGAHLIQNLEPTISSAAWSPDGKTIVVSAALPATILDLQGVRALMPRQATLFLVSAEGGGEPHALLHHGAGPAAWSPDGKKLVFSTVTEESAGTFYAKFAIHTVNADGTREVSLANCQHGHRMASALHLTTLRRFL
jgi:Tol biopolymer transport system component